MRNTLRVMLFSCVVATTAAAQAPGEGGAEAQAVIKRGEVAHLDRDSIGQYGPATRFDVTIAWDDAQGKRPEDHQSRIVRYVADCKASSLTVAAVGVFDRTGTLVKRMILPPGGADPVTPEAGSQQAKWLKDVCAN